jgi:hypothetical protein
MAKIIKFFVSFVEFAPAPMIPHRKVSHTPVLETIAEEKEVAK